MTMKRVHVFTLLIGLPAAAQAPQAVEGANASYQAQDYKTALSAYAGLAKEAPKNPLFVFRQGASLLGLDRPQEALPFFEAATGLGFGAAQMQIWSARALSRMGQLDRAFAAIEKAAEGGFSNLSLLDTEKDLEALRRDPRFAKARENVDRKARPCAYGPEFRQLDFWIGDWDVTASGAVAGESRVEKIIGECVIFENWSGASGMVGKSFNLWDATKHEWRQTWVDSSGGLHEYHGRFGDGKLVYEAENLQRNPDGTLQPLKLRMTFFDQGGQVRQLGEQSTDAGKTWTVAYDLLYKRKAKS